MFFNFNLDSALLPLQRKWPFNLVGYLLRLQNVFLAGSLASLVGVLAVLGLRNSSRFPAAVYVLPFALSLLGFSASKLAHRLLVTEIRRLLRTIRDVDLVILKKEKELEFSVEHAGSDQEKLVALAQLNKFANLWRQGDELREKLEDILTAPSPLSRNVDRLMTVVGMVRELASAQMLILSFS